MGDTRYDAWIGEVVRTDGGLEIAPLLAGRGARGRPTDDPANPLENGAIVLVRAGAPAIVERRLAPPGSARAEVYRLAARSGLDPLYPAEVRQEVADLRGDGGTDDPALDDLEHLPFVTIDNADSRDLDQALYVSRAGQGFEVHYAIADASHFVTPSSALLAEALARGSSYYLPGLTLPMLPPQLSEDLISLNEGQRRRALVFMMRLDEDGTCRATRLVRARVRSRRKLSYVRVQRSWDDPWGSGFSGEPFADSLRLLREVGRLRLAEAHRRHVVDHHRVELDVRAGPGGGFTVAARERLEVERCNEQISLLCNVEGAKILVEGRGLEHVQPIFRVHPAPTRSAVASFARATVWLARMHGAEPSTWRAAPGRGLRRPSSGRRSS
jgi:ribonuclease R